MTIFHYEAGLKYCHLTALETLIIHNQEVELGSGYSFHFQSGSKLAKFPNSLKSLKILMNFPVLIMPK